MENYFNVEYVAVEGLKRGFQNTKFVDEIGANYKRQWARLLWEKSITTSEYEEITSDRYDSEDELYKFLREIWDEVFDSEPLPSLESIEKFREDDEKEPTPDPVPFSLREGLRRYFQHDDIAINRFKKAYQTSEVFVYSQGAPFKKELAQVLRDRSMTPALYKEITGQNFPTEEALYAWLQHIWDYVYDNEPLPE